MKRRLSDLESAVAFGGNALPDALEAMDQELNLLEKLREEGQPARRELYERCKVIAGSMILSKRNAKPLDEAERRLIRQLMIAICKYFELRGRYEHDFGGAIGALSARVAAWKSGNIRLTVANVRETREVLAKVMQRMSDDWGEISSHFLYIQTSVELNLKIKQALKLAQIHDNVPLEHVELWGAVA
jgi:hypothetical protein